MRRTLLILLATTGLANRISGARPLIGRLVKLVLSGAYAAAPLVLSLSLERQNPAGPTAVLWGANVLLVLVAIWSSYLFWSLGSWLRHASPSREDVADWIVRTLLSRLSAASSAREALVADLTPLFRTARQVRRHG